MKNWLVGIPVVAMAFAVPVDAEAIRWKHLGSDKNGDHAFYNAKTLSFDKGFAKAWTKIEKSVSDEKMKNKGASVDEYKGSSSIRVYQEFDCSGKKKKNHIGKVYIGENPDSDVQLGDWEPVKPGTLEEVILDAVCRDGRKLVEKNK